MKADAYTKVILTIIAVALIWIAAGGTSLLPAVEAQDRTPQHVIVVGWQEGGAAGSRALPLPIQVSGWRDSRGGTYFFPQPTPVEAARQQGAGLPTRGDR